MTSGEPWTAAAAQHAIEWRWVKGHADDELNERADRLAREGMAEFKNGVEHTP